MHDETLAVSFKYFQVQYGEESTERLPAILDGIVGNPPREQIAEIQKIERILKTRTHTFNGYKAWLFANKRTRGLPMKIKSDGSSESLMLNEEEGLGENAALACDPTGRVVSIQSNRHAMSEKIIARFINMFRPETSVGFLPILRVDAVERLSRASQVRRLHVCLAGMVDFSLLQQYGMSVEDAMSMQRLHQSPTMEVTWSMGHQKGGLIDRVENVLRALIDYKNTPEGQTQIRALDASLTLEENGGMVTSPVDFLTDRLYYLADVPLNTRRELDEDALLVAARSALIERRNDLREYIQNPQSD